MPNHVSTCVPVSIIGNSAAIRHIRETARLIAGGDPKVLLTGESGVGKDVIARYVHAQSCRASRPFVPVNCAAISDTLLEAELFGHVKGSFTGAYRDKIGRVQIADRGTIFLDEIGETSPRMQALLLRFLENGEIHPVGSEAVAKTVDVRVIAATNQDLRALIASGHFREDLFYRLNVVHIVVPPLRERTEDLPLLVEHILQQTGRPLRFSDEAIQLLLSYRWPGNIRELRNVIEQVGWTAKGDTVTPAELPPAIRAEVSSWPKRERRRRRAEDLYRALAAGQLNFWDDVYKRFIQRDLTRDDVRELVRLGLEHAGGNFRAMLPLFGLNAADYKRFLNFLAAHDCCVDFRAFRAMRDGAPPPQV